VVTEGQKVDVYWNLHRNCYSVKARTGPNAGRVIAHAETVTVRNVQLVVSQSGRRRVLKEQRKNVHAVLRGEWSAPCDAETVGITYNPYKYETFVLRNSEAPILTAAVAVGRIVEGRARMEVVPA